MKVGTTFVACLISFFVFSEVLQADVNLGLVSYYPFNGNANDEYDDNHGEVNGATLTADRFNSPNSAYSFNQFQYINLGSQSNFIFNREFCSFMAWFKISEPDEGYSSIISGSNDLVSPFLGFKNENPVWGQNPSSDDDPELCTSPYQIKDNNWHHIAGTFMRVSYDEDLSLYIDGVLVAQKTYRYKYLGGEGILFIGFSHGTIQGSIDDVRIYNRTLSSTDIKEIYNSDVNSAQIKVVWDIDLNNQWSLPDIIFGLQSISSMRSREEQGQTLNY